MYFLKSCVIKDSKFHHRAKSLVVICFFIDAYSAIPTATSLFYLTTCVAGARVLAHDMRDGRRRVSRA